MGYRALGVQMGYHTYLLDTAGQPRPVTATDAKFGSEQTRNSPNLANGVGARMVPF